MAVISLNNISIAFGGEKLLDSINLQIEKNQRVCLLGRNGAGKSTLMKIINQEIDADSGELQFDKSLTTSYLAQNVLSNLHGSIFKIIAHGLGERGKLLVSLKINNFDEIDIEELEKNNVWSAFQEIKEIMNRMSLSNNWNYEELSGGQRRRVLLAKSLVAKPDLLLLDEPTNHLDIPTIQWLEEYLCRFNITLIFVTHDRSFLKKIATRIIELDRGTIFDWSCDYETFLERKKAVLEIEEKERANFDKKLAKEETWIRQGIKARRTRNEGRVRALKKMREEKKSWRLKEGNANLIYSEAQKSGRLVLRVKDLCYKYDDQMLINKFDTIITRGDKIGIVGPNGCGKTTLVNLLLKNLKPISGNVEHGENLSILYYEQMRKELDEDKTVWENVLPNGDQVDIQGKRKHIVTYLKDFLFSPDRIKSPVKQLSGGEKNRLLLAKLFTQPANVMVFDEPTNDLDAETLELLEELLFGFSGTVLLISHDRTFINNVVTSTLVFEEKGIVHEYVGGYDDYLSQKNMKMGENPLKEKSTKKQKYIEEKRAKREKKITFKEQKELDKLPKIIEQQEKRQQEIHAEMANPENYKEKELIIKLKSEMEQLEKKLIMNYERWECLEEKIS